MIAPTSQRPDNSPLLVDLSELIDVREAAILLGITWESMRALIVRGTLSYVWRKFLFAGDVRAYAALRQAELAQGKPWRGER